MMDMSSIIDATLACAGMVAVLAAGIWSLSEGSTTVSTTSVHPESGLSASERRNAA